MIGKSGLVLALAGGVGGAKLVEGLSRVLAPDELVVVVNTGDDFVHLGLHISPDLDTVMYTLAGLSHPEQGWGLAGETFHAMAALERLGGETWFRLGDRDLATHLERTPRLAKETLSAVTADLSRRLGVRHAIVPMSNDPVRTMVDTDAGSLAFQDYFVRRKCAPVVKAIYYDGIDRATPAPEFAAALSSPDLRAVIICPSNPYLSIAPILGLKGIKSRLEGLGAPVVAVSPIIGGQAVKGPAAKIMNELGVEVSPRGIAGYYEGQLDGLIIDAVDAPLGAAPGAPALFATKTLMRTAEDKTQLARDTVDFCARIARP